MFKGLRRCDDDDGVVVVVVVGAAADLADTVGVVDEEEGPGVLAATDTVPTERRRRIRAVVTESSK